MLNLDSTIKDLYKQPGATKELELYFPSIPLTLTKTNIVAESLKLTEGICSGNKLAFGLCEGSQLNFSLYDVNEDLTGLDFTATHIINENIVSLGSYKVLTCKKSDDLKYKFITAYDHMRKIDVDVALWYNALTFPLTLAAFRASLLSHLGLIEVISTLPNDNMIVNKTIEPSQLSGRVSLEACEEINGAFGHIGRDGKFKHIVLKPMHNDYPQDDYPTNDYPQEGPYDENIYPSDYREIKFEEYRVLPIDKLQIRQEENDVGCIVGTGTNAYIIQGNFLVFGKTAEELEVIANNASTNIFNRGYRPYTATQNGLPYLEVGDFVWYNADDSTAGYIFKRILTGIQALQDEFEAQGSEQQEQAFGVSQEIIQLKGRATTIEKSVDGVKIDITDLDLQLTSDINFLAGQVVIKVDTAGNIGYIELDADPDTDLTTFKVKANNISLEGLVTVNNNFKVLADGSIETANGKFSGDITASTYIGGSIQSSNYVAGVSGMKIDLSTGIIYIEDGAAFVSTGSEEFTMIDEGIITTTLIYAEAMSVHDGLVTIDATGLYALNAIIPTLNGGTPLTSLSTIPIPSHTHSIYEITLLVDIINDITARLSTLEGA